MAKVYIAAKYHRRFELRSLADALRARGVEVTSRWIDNGEDEAAERGGPGAAAQMDLDDVVSADAVIFIGEPRGSKNTGGGRFFELGFAYGLGKRLIAVLGADGVDPTLGCTGRGHETVFTSLPRFECVDTTEDAIGLVAA
jgi:nucleoside 2-deoxyribosyltransferase